MPLILLLVGAVLIVAAIRGTHTALFTALESDVPGFAIWGAAIVALGVVGFVPGLKPSSRALLALVIVVLVLNNAQSALAGFTAAWQGAQGQASGATGTGASNASLGVAAGSAAGAVTSGAVSIINNALTSAGTSADGSTGAW